MSDDGFEVGAPPVTAGAGRVRAAAHWAFALAVVAVAGWWLLKKIPTLYEHEPWQNDPYDAVVSFAVVAVSLLAVLVLAGTLVPASAPGASRRLIDLLRAAWLLAWVVAGTEISDWISVIVRADRAAWSATTPIAVAVLAGLTGFTVLVLRILARARGTVSSWPQPPDRPDWLDVGLLLLVTAAGRLGRGAEASRMLAQLDRTVLMQVRRHSLRVALVGAIALAGLTDTPQVVLEGYSLPLAILFFSISACSYFTFAMLAGGYLRLAPPRRPVRFGVRVTVATAAAVVLAAAFRTTLWPLLGITVAEAGPTQLVVLVAVAAAVAILIGLPIDYLSVRRSGADPGSARPAGERGQVAQHENQHGGAAE